MAAVKRKVKRRRGERKHIPPPPPFWRYETNGFWGMAILAENPESDALVLWRAARAARAFAERGAKPRTFSENFTSASESFRLGSEAERDAVPSLEAFAKVRSSDVDVSSTDLAEACARVSAWADEGWKRETAIHFAELAARIDSDSATRANAAGRLCRDVGLMDRATVWFQRGFRLAVRNKDREAAVRAQLGYGALLQEVGRLGAARRWFLRAARRAARTGRRKTAAETRHDLMALDAEIGNFSGVARHAEIAATLYPLYHDRLPYLAHDFAFALVKQQHYTEALALLELFARCVPERYTLPGVATLAWAAAGRGLAHRFEEMERRVLIRIRDDQQQAAPSLIFLAEGARRLGRWERAEQHARNAVEVSRRLKQPRYERDAGTLLAAILGKISEAAPAGAVGQDVRRIARHLTARLRRWKPRGESEPDAGTPDRAAQANG